MKVAGFDWDKGNWPKCGQHGLSRADIESVFEGGPAVLADRNPPMTEMRYNAVGKTDAGRYAFIVFTLREKEGRMLIRPISARYMHKKEIESYERQERR